MTLTILVTVGSTQFHSLTHHISTLSVLQALARHGCTSLTIQHGSAPLPSLPASDQLPTINTFNYTPDLAQHLQRADLIISHAGAGTVSEALARRKRMLVVVNDKLMHDHQTELAEELARRGCCVMMRAADLEQQFDHKIRQALALKEEHIRLPDQNEKALAHILAQQLGLPVPQ